MKETEQISGKTDFYVDDSGHKVFNGDLQPMNYTERIGDCYYRIVMGRRILVQDEKYDYSGM